LLSLPNACFWITKVPLFRCFLEKIYDIYKELNKEKVIDNAIHSFTENNAYHSRLTIECLLSLVFHHFYFNSTIENEVHVIYSDQSYNRKLFIKYRNHKDFGFSLQNSCFELVLKKIRYIDLVSIVEAILQEKKIILIYENYEQNAVIIEALLSLIIPL